MMTTDQPTQTRRTLNPTALAGTVGVVAGVVALGAAITVTTRPQQNIDIGKSERLQTAEIGYSAARLKLFELTTAHDHTSGMLEQTPDGAIVIGSEPLYRGLLQKLRHALAAKMHDNAIAETGDPNNPHYRASPAEPLADRMQQGVALVMDATEGAATLPIILTYTDPGTGDTIQVGLTPDELATLGVNRVLAASDAQTFQFVTEPDVAGDIQKFLTTVREVRLSFVEVVGAGGDGETAVSLQQEITP